MNTGKNNGPTINPGLCRCCRNLKKCRTLTHEYVWMQNKEVYSDMFMDCFGLLLSHLDGESSECCVCATCVVRLRDACAFRTQVLKCEEAFLKEKIQLNSDETSKSVVVKFEPLDEIDHDNDSNSLQEDMDSDKPAPSNRLQVVEPCVSVKGEITDGATSEDNDDEKCPNTIGVGANSRIKRDTGDDVKTVERRRLVSQKRIIKLQNEVKCTRVGLRRKLVKVPHKTLTAGPSTVRCLGKKMRLKVFRTPVKDDHEHMVETNMITIAECSYACPFSSRFSTYFCYYCNVQCASSHDLRAHTIAHDPKQFKAIFKRRRHSKIDVTRVDCRLCDATIDDLKAFGEHVAVVHGRKFYAQVEDAFLKYRLTDDRLSCVVCDASFPFFDKLHRHMVEHYGKYTCDVCGALFLEENSLKVHLDTHDLKKHTCHVCNKVLPSQSALGAHVDSVHEKIPSVACRACDGLFLTPTERERHMREAHAATQVHPCSKCEKIYNRKKSLNEHYRRCHLKLYRHQCEYCFQKFFTPLQLKDHMTTHTGEKNYRCEFCDKSYPRLKALQQHIRIHTNDRRYKCKVCNSSFIQNVSLKCHMKSHHPEYVVDK